MFLLESNNNFKIKTVHDLLKQKKVKIVDTKNEKFFQKLYLYFGNNQIEVLFMKEKKIFKCPINFNVLVNAIIELLSNFEIKYKNLTYCPIKHRITKDYFSASLGEIHNLILIYLFLSQKQGILKDELYAILWPNDKNIQINKLDTHLTNLKSFLYEKINFSIKISSSKGNISLGID